MVVADVERGGEGIGCARHPISPLAAVNVVVPVERARESGAVRRASASQKRATGRVFGSKNSMRWSRVSSLSPVPARFMALVGVVGTLMIGIFGARSFGLTGGFPSGYWVISS
jgi:hypothetical protein